MLRASRFRLWIFLGAALAGILVVAVWLGGPAKEKKRTWRSAVPSHPDLATWPSSFQQRIQSCETRLRGWPPDSEALAELARLYVANGFSAEAEQTLRALLRYQPSNAQWPHHLANVLAGLGKLDEAVRYWKETIALQPDYTPARLKSADALRKLNRRDEAVHAYGEILGQQPLNVYALLGLAVIDLDAGNWVSAKERLETAIAADSSFWGGFSLLSTVAEHLGDAALAERARRRADEIGRFRDAPDPWTDDLMEYCYDVYRLQVIASTIATTGNPRGALAPLQRAVQLAPDDARTRRHLGKVYLMVNDVPHAREQLERSIALEPNEPTSYVELEKVYKTNNDVKGAEALLATGLKNCVDAPALHYEYALVLIALGRVEEAVPQMERARDLAPENIGTYEKLSMAFFRLGRVTEGIAALQAGLKYDPNSGPLIMMMGRYAIQAGDAPAAESYLKRARELGAPDANVAEFVQIFERRFGRPPQQ